MNNIVPIGQARMPAAMKDRLASGAAVNKNFADGVVDSFPLLSIKGKVFRIRRDGKELLADRQLQPGGAQPRRGARQWLPTPSPRPTTIKGFDPDDATNPPDCWSLDSVKPDPSVANKVNPTCVNCPMNAFGSRVSDRGGAQRAGKACSDSRRVAVVMPADLANPQPMTFLLSVPQTSLKNLKEYASCWSGRGGSRRPASPGCSSTTEAEFPKLLFYFVDGLTDDEYAKVVDIGELAGDSSDAEGPELRRGRREADRHQCRYLATGASGNAEDAGSRRGDAAGAGAGAARCATPAADAGPAADLFDADPVADGAGQRADADRAARRAAVRPDDRRVCRAGQAQGRDAAGRSGGDRPA